VPNRAVVVFSGVSTQYPFSLKLKERDMTREIKALLACNMLTLIVAVTACYFAFEARKEAKGASYSADWGASRVADELNDLQRTVDQIAEDTKLMSSDARTNEQVQRILRGY
jgi:cell shape-determining protein MreC